ncbi:MAG TPA: helix-turn-helix domain-containing protein [Ignavibacteriales bacterium]|nr:helix-turn-helix domain-containing protein [Ignavibacteriales bacterium]
MKQKLNITEETLQKLNYNQARISKELDVSRETVSKWFKGENFPRPAKLLQLGKLLGMTYDELVSSEADKLEPIIAFRSVRKKNTPDGELRRAKEMGYALEKLVEFVPFEIIFQYKKLENPKIDPEYIRNAVKGVKERLKIKNDIIDINNIIHCFEEYKTILIPLLQGERQGHENALHIYLPESGTNWIYINLDTYTYDFKFWLIHEFGHVLTPTLNNETEREDFADKFAQEFLYPSEKAAKLYFALSGMASIPAKLSRIVDEAYKLEINPYTVAQQLEAFAVNSNMPKLDLGNSYAYFQSRTEPKLVSAILFSNKKPDVETYITAVQEKFNTKFFEILKDYINLNQDSYQFLRVVLNLPITDVKEINNFLKASASKNTA